MAFIIKRMSKGLFISLLLVCCLTVCLIRPNKSWFNVPVPASQALAFGLPSQWATPLLLVANDMRKIDRNKWEEAKEGLDYNERPPEEAEEEELDLSPSNSLFFNAGSGMQVVFYVVVIALLALVLYFLFKGNYIKNAKLDKNKQLFSIEDIENIEENIHTANLHSLLKEAIRQREFKLAIRIYYLIIIRELSEQELIRWKREKTNFEYIREMANNPHHDQFREVTILFERIWYGDKLVNEPIYDNAKPYFSSFLATIQKTEQS